MRKRAKSSALKVFTEAFLARVAPAPGFVGESAPRARRQAILTTEEAYGWLCLRIA